MSIDRERFLVLVLAIAAQACGKSTADGVVVVPVVMVPLESTASATAPSELARATPPASAGDSSPRPDVQGPTPCEIDNDTGTVDCSRIKARKVTGPACEGGIAGTCDLLAKDYAYRRRSAEAAAECMTRAGARACDIHARKKCFEEGVKAACPEPRFDAQCEAKMDECRAAKVRIQYTKEDCMKAMSSQHERDRAWAISQMGPSSEGKCQLMFTVF